MYISFLRLEWDLNPRMTVLQTVALGHLAIQPNCLLRGDFTYSRSRSQANSTLFSAKNQKATASIRHRGFSFN